MTYQVLQPPFTLRFDEMSKDELRSYYSWFMEIRLDRIALLERTVQLQVPKWRADLSTASLEPLDVWFGSQIDTRSLTSEETRTYVGILPPGADLPAGELT